jgi:hypothetical protein
VYSIRCSEEITLEV